MSDRTVIKVDAVPGRFVAFWLLSLVIPGLILSAVRALILGYSTSAVGYQMAVLAPAPVWLLAAFWQYRLLRPYMRRSVWWVIATFVGGCLGVPGGGLAMIWMTPHVEVLVLGNESTPEWMFAAYPLLPAAFAGAVAAAILGLSQALSLGQGFRRGVLWFGLSALSGAIAAACGGIAHLAYVRVMIELNPAAVVTGTTMQVIIALSIAMTAGLIVYGLLTGIVMRRLLFRRAGLQRADLVGQFE